MKPDFTIYPEFSTDPNTWRNDAAPPLDADLVRELENIARLPDGRPRYRVRWMQDCYIEVPDTPEYNDGGMLVGIEKGGLFHDDPQCIFDVATGYKYNDERGFTKVVKDKYDAAIPEGTVLEPIIETVSIGIPRFRVEEWLDQTTGAIYDGDYYASWVVEDKIFIQETEEVFEYQSNFRQFSRFDVEKAKDVFNERQNIKTDEKRRAIQEQAERIIARKKAAIAAQDAEDAAMIDKFFRDKEYKPKEEGMKIYV